MKLVVPVLLSLVIMSSCASPEAEKTNVEEPQAQIEENCLYRYNADSTQFTWTGYKFTERVGVSGTFQEIYTEGFTEQSNIIDLLSGVDFKIPVASIESNNSDRNNKIISFFFGSMNTETIYGQIQGLSGEGEKGIAKVLIRMNSMEQIVPMNYTFENGLFEMEAEIDIENWNGSTGIEKLNEACYDLHKGADGVSLLWPNVLLNVKSRFDRVCP